MSSFVSSPSSGGGDDGGGTPITDVTVGYIRPDGSDGGDGSPGKPFATAQAAYNAGFFNLDLGNGDAGNLLLAGSAEFCVRGRGAQSTLMIQTYGSDLQVVDAGYQSVGLTIDASNATTGGNGGGVILNNCLVSGAINTTASAGDPDVFGNGGSGGTVQLFNCLVLGEITSVGGDGAPGDGGTPGSGGGSGGAVEATQCQMNSSFLLTGGAAGSDGGAGSGSQGPDGIISGRLSIFVSSLPGSATLQGCVVAGNFANRP